jgi:hypothetical protein
MQTVRYSLNTSGVVNAGHMTLNGLLGSILNSYPWPKPNFQDTHIRLYVEQIDSPASFRLIATCHAVADQAAKQAGGFAELARNESTDHS